MPDEDKDEPKVVCGVCGLEIKEHALCYEIRYGTIIGTRFEHQEPYMVVHSNCLKE